MALHLDLAEDLIRKQIAALEAELNALAAQQREIHRRSQQLTAERDRWLGTLCEEESKARNGSRLVNPLDAG